MATWMDKIFTTNKWRELHVQYVSDHMVIINRGSIKIEESYLQPRTK